MDDPDSDPVIVRALLDMATVWRCWGLVQHRDGRIFAGRAGDIRIFGTVMLRLDMPTITGATTIVFNIAAVDDLLVCPEQEARDALSVMDEPETIRTILSRLAALRLQGGGHDNR